MDIITRVNWVDIIVVILFLRMSYGAFQDGFGKELFKLLISAGVAILTFNYYNKIALILSQNISLLPLEFWRVLGFIGFVILSSLLLRVIKAILDNVFQVSWHPLIDKAGGILAGVARASIVISMVLASLTIMPLSYLKWSVAERSLTGNYFLRIAPALYEKTARLFPGNRARDAVINRDDIVGQLLGNAYTPKAKKAKDPEDKKR